MATMTPSIRQHRGYTLIEVALVTALLVIVVAFAAPNLIRDIEGRRLPESARQLRSLLTHIRANAMYDGKRYRIRFPLEDEQDSEGGRRQPIIEREDEPFREPGVFNRVEEWWARGETLLEGVRCARVRLGRPTIESLEDRFVDEELDQRFEMLMEEFDENFPPLVVETDGTSEWVVLLLTDAPPEAEEEEVEEFAQVEVILDGLTGLCWLQRPFYDEELEMFKEHDWPPVLRKDFVRKEALTEADVLEIAETRVRR
jgi:prepilin-type N-terminal cleavage/methylation domain-containing protein